MDSKVIHNFLDKKLEKFSIANKKRRDELLDRIREVRLIFAQYPSVRRAWLFGSILNEDFFNERSDVDIAIQGIDSGSYFGLYANLSEIFGENLDLVEIERISWAENILGKGLLIYEKK